MCRWEEFRNYLREEVVKHRDDMEVEFCLPHRCADENSEEGSVSVSEPADLEWGLKRFNL